MHFVVWWHLKRERERKLQHQVIIVEFSNLCLCICVLNIRIGLFQPTNKKDEWTKKNEFQVKSIASVNKTFHLKSKKKGNFSYFLCYIQRLIKQSMLICALLLIPSLILSFHTMWASVCMTLRSSAYVSHISNCVNGIHDAFTFVHSQRWSAFSGCT